MAGEYVAMLVVPALVYYNYPVRPDTFEACVIQGTVEYGHIQDVYASLD